MEDLNGEIAISPTYGDLLVQVASLRSSLEALSAEVVALREDNVQLREENHQLRDENQALRDEVAITEITGIVQGPAVTARRSAAMEGAPRVNNM